MQKTINTFSFELILFSNDCQFIQIASQAGVHAIIVDWENKGKVFRQRGADTEINFQTRDDLERIRRCTDRWLLCRINAFSEHTQDEVEEAITGGADEIILPMVENVSQVDQVLSWIDQRVKLGILVETINAVEQADLLADRPLSRVFFGLNDYAIQCGTTNIFKAIADGTVERVRNQLSSLSFGFAGLTLPDQGSPIPCDLLMSEMNRLRCNFSFLRRSFHRHIAQKDPLVEIPRILRTLEEKSHLPVNLLNADHQKLIRLINSIAVPEDHVKL